MTTARLWKWWAGGIKPPGWILAHHLLPSSSRAGSFRGFHPSNTFTTVIESCQKPEKGLTIQGTGILALPLCTNRPEPPFPPPNSVVRVWKESLSIKTASPYRSCCKSQCHSCSIFHPDPQGDPDHQQSFVKAPWLLLTIS